MAKASFEAFLAVASDPFWIERAKDHLREIEESLWESDQ